MSDISFEKIQWKDAIESVRALDPEFVKIVETLDIDSSYHLYRATYPYGAKIVNRGVVYIPDSNDNNILKSIHDTSLPAQVRDDLSYNYGSIPTYFILKNCIEVFLESPHHTYTAQARKHGDSLGGITGILSETGQSYQPPFHWDVTAGMRSVFMLPSIANKRGHDALQRNYNITAAAPINIIDHWSVFTELYKNSNPENPWETELLFFSRKWFETMRSEIRNQNGWDSLYAYISQSLINKAGYWLHKFVWDSVYFGVREKLDKMPCPYLTNTVESLLDVAVGQVPGLISAIDDSAGPLSTIQSMYIDTYKLDYYPTIIQPGYLHNATSNIEKAIYYSLKHPSTVGYANGPPAKNKIALALSRIRDLLEHYINLIGSDDLNVYHTPTAGKLQDVKFDFYFKDDSHYPFINVGTQLLVDDDRFKDIGQYPSDATFTQGCIKLSYR